MSDVNAEGVRRAKPKWLKRRLPTGAACEQVRNLIKEGRLHTVCQEAQCPNMWECFSKHTATFLILGSRCTRHCRFCAVEHGPQGPPDPEEPTRVAQAVQRMNLRYAVVTSVTRDDLADGGAAHFAATIRAIRAHQPQALVEVLIPDFQGDLAALQAVVAARPDVLNHNIETVARLYPRVRPQAQYQRSLDLLDHAHRLAPAMPTKSGLMLGLGETTEEIRQCLRDLRRVKCQILTLGQYLQPTREHLPVEEFVAPETFARWKQFALQIGFVEVASGPFVRSSYHARELFQAASQKPS